MEEYYKLQLIFGPLYDTLPLAYLFRSCFIRQTESFLISIEGESVCMYIDVGIPIVLRAPSSSCFI